MKLELHAYDIASRDLGDLDMRKLTQSMQASETLVVNKDALAIPVAHKIDDGRFGLVVIEEFSTPRAIWVPPFIRQRMAQHLNIVAPTFAEILTIYAADPQQQQRNFEHEWLNFDRPKIGWCEMGKHYTSKPCPAHG